jgi:hypothetical protein
MNSRQSGVVEIVPGRGERGEYLFSVLVKRSYRFAHRKFAERAEIDRPLRMTDEYFDHGDPEWATVQHESELAPYKPAIDVVVLGKAHAAGQVATPQMEVNVAVAGREKVLRIIGDRRCQHRAGRAPSYSEPLPFTEMELRYDYAYGGRDDKSLPDIPFFYPRNFMGKGVALRNVPEVVQDLSLPNIEDPADLLTPERVVIEDPQRWHLQPLPQGLGWRQRTWYPRCALLGSYPAFLSAGTVTEEERLGLLPQNHVALAKQNRLAPFEARFNNGASLGMIFTRLESDERITLRGLSPDGLLDFRLPGETPRIGLDLGPGLRELEVRMHTVSIRPDDLELDIVWRGAHAYPGYHWLPKMTRLHAEVH